MTKLQERVKEVLTEMLKQAEECQTDDEIIDMLLDDLRVDELFGREGIQSNKTGLSNVSEPYEDNTLIQAELPKSSYNIGISIASELYADSNDSSKWWRILVPLPKPKGKWIIIKEEEKHGCILLTLEDRTITKRPH